MQCPFLCQATPLEKTCPSFKVEFSSQTGDEKSYGTGVLKIEFFGQLLKEFDKRMMVGESNSHVPRRGESVAFVLFGILIGLSLLHSGSRYYMFQDWMYEVINDKDDQDHLLLFLAKSSIPLHAGSSGAMKFLNKLDKVKTQNELDDLVDKNIQLINCSHWDPTKPIAISNKAYLGTEIAYDELVRKRIAQIRMIPEDLQISGFWPFMVDHPNVCR